VTTVAIVLSVFLADPGEDLASLNCCGPFALQVCALVAGGDVSHDRVLQLVPISEDGCSLDDLDYAAQALGLRTLALRWQGELPKSPFPPAVIPVVNRRGVRHFVAMLAREGDQVLVVDAPHRPVWVPIESLHSSLKWDGHALHVAVDDVAIELLRRHFETPPGWLWLGAAPAALVLCAALRKFHSSRGRLTAMHQ